MTAKISSNHATAEVFSSNFEAQLSTSERTLNFNDLLIEIRLSIVHLLFPPARMHIFKYHDIRFPGSYIPNIGKRVYDDCYPVTLHINRECRYATLRFYKLAIWDLLRVNPNFHNYDMKPLLDLSMRITTWWCFDPARDVFRITPGTMSFHMLQSSIRNPGLMDMVRHIQWERPACSPFNFWFKTMSDSGLLSITRLRNLESFTIFLALRSRKSND